MEPVREVEAKEWNGMEWRETDKENESSVFDVLHQTI